jgi:hypothetical protein
VFRCHPELAFGWKPSRLAVLEQLLRWRRSRLRPVDVNKGAGGWIGKARAMRARAKVIRTTMPDPQAMLSHFDRHFRQVLRKAKAHADRVIVARQPWFDRECTADEAAQMWHGGVGQAWKEEVSAYYSHDVLRRLMSLLDARAARLAEELEVEQLDIRDVVEPSLENYYDFFHATPAGARAVASAVAMTMVRLPLPSVDELTAPKRAS